MQNAHVDYVDDGANATVVINILRLIANPTPRAEAITGLAPMRRMASSSRRRGRVRNKDRFPMEEEAEGRVPGMADATVDDYQLAFDESVRNLEGQERTIDELRNRSGILLATVTGTTAFLGGFDLNGHHNHPLEILGGSLFGVVLLLLGLVLRPANDWIFRNDAGKIIKEWIEGTPKKVGVDLRRELALLGVVHASANAKKMVWRWRFFEAAFFLVGLESAAWLLALVIR